MSILVTVPSSGTVTTQAPVETYVTALGRALSGPRRRKADLLAEARDSLEDATEAFEAGGLRRWEAEEQAVADFGDLDEVAPGYRAELGIAQGRRTAVLLCLVILAQPIIWEEGVWAWNQHPDATSGPSVFLNGLVMVVGVLSAAGAVIGLLATSVGLRYPVVRDHSTRWTAVFALISCASVIVIAVLMAMTSAGRNSSPISLAVVTGFVVLPLTLVGRSARRCLRLA
jgi:hypothetical protein